MASVSGSAGDNAWWSEKWIALLDDLGVAPAARSRSAIHRARVQRLEILPGRVVARVQDKELGDCDVELQLTQLDSAQWQAATDALAEQALFVAQLLAGDLQPEIEQVFIASGMGLLPSSGKDLTYTCSCSIQADESPTRPIIAVHMAVGDMLLENPGLLFRLRGRERQEMLSGLRTLRNRAAAAASIQLSSQERPVVVELPTVYRSAPQADDTGGMPLSEQVDCFWGQSKQLSEFQHHIAKPAIELAIMRRLGPFPYSGDSMVAYDRLTAIYTDVTDAALAMAYASDPEADEDESLDD